MEDKPLSFNIFSLRLLLIWPSNGKNSVSHAIKNIIFNIISYISSGTTSASFYRQTLTGFDDMDAAVGGFVGFVDFICAEYMKVYFLSQLKHIKRLIASIEDFREFCEEEKIWETEDKIRKYSKALIFYCLFGNVLNAGIPLLDRESCNQRRENDLNRFYDPCGLMCHCYFPFDVSGRLYPYLFFVQFYSCTLVSMSVIAITMMLVGCLLHTIDQLHNLRHEIRTLESYIETGTGLRERVTFIIKYHIKIIQYNDDINAAFSGMMLLHLTLTSVVMSLLGFQVITSFLNDLYSESIRFNLHFCGWFILVLLVCFYGQLLIDESIAVAHDVYSLSWFNAPVDIQKDLRMVLLRSQKPLELSAANIGNMSLPMFLGVLSNAYSYFTLLLNIRS